MEKIEEGQKWVNSNGQKFLIYAILYNYVDGIKKDIKIIIIYEKNEFMTDVTLEYFKKCFRYTIPRQIKKIRIIE